MSEFASLREALDALRSDMESYSRTLERGLTLRDIDSQEIWGEIADLRDDHHALANRVESLFRSISLSAVVPPIEGDAA